MDMNKQIIEGKITRAVKPKLREFFGSWCSVSLDKVDIIDNYSNETRSYFTMLDINPRAASQTPQ